MDEQTAAALAKRLAAYSATATVALTVAPTPEAQIVYHDLDPDAVVDLDTPGPYAWQDVDFDDNGGGDIRLWGYDLVSGNPIRNEFVLYPAFGAPLGNSLVAYETSFGLVAGLSRLSSGDAIGPLLNAPQEWWGGRAYAAMYEFSPPGGEFPFLGTEGYAGFRFVGGDGEHRYGWLRLAVSEQADVATVSEYAYEATPGVPVLAGARSAALLDGAVDQTDFPASGGTLRYTFAVENTTAEPLPLDLWLDADGPETVTRRLGFGTLAPGATVTRTVRVQVPAGAPAGDYDVRFKVGDFATDRFITFERYAITKEAGAETAATGAEPFAVAPFEGDLFAEAEAVAGVVGTHALRAPTPNPTTGRSEFALTVMETQAVSVTVYDALGRHIALLHDGPMAAGTEHRLVFDGSALPAGMYVVRAVGETFADTRALTLTR